MHNVYVVADHKERLVRILRVPDILKEKPRVHRIKVVRGLVKQVYLRVAQKRPRVEYLLPQPPGGPVWFAVFENRLGRLPPWGGSATSPAGSPPS